MNKQSVLYKTTHMNWSICVDHRTR